MKKVLLLAVFSTVSLLSGCAHQISIAPKIDDEMIASDNQSEKVAGYYISNEDRSLQVTTPGGGGDKVTYKPYADLELGLDAVLSKKYSAVYSMPKPDDVEFIKAHNIDYVFVPKLKTDSDSDSAFTWPPTSFTVDMNCKAVNSSGNIIWQRDIKGEGKASFSEFKSNFSLSAQRASSRLLALLRQELDKAAELQ